MTKRSIASIMQHGAARSDTVSPSLCPFPYPRLFFNCVSFSPVFRWPTIPLTAHSSAERGERSVDAPALANHAPSLQGAGRHRPMRGQRGGGTYPVHSHLHTENQWCWRDPTGTDSVTVRPETHAALRCINEDSLRHSRCHGRVSLRAASHTAPLSQQLRQQHVDGRRSRPA